METAFASTGSEISDSISGNLTLVLIVIVLVIVAVAVLRAVDVIDRYRMRVKLDELETKKEKLKQFARTQKRKALKDALMALNPEERKHIYSIWEDNSVVSRKALFGLNELEERTRRAERGSEVLWTKKRISELKETEKKLFPGSFKER